MYFSRILKVSLLIAVMVAIAGCSATPTRRSFKEGWKDSVVSTKVKIKLTGDKLVKKRNIDVDTWRGVVTMTGRVTSMEEKERAEQLAWQIRGVRGVDNYLKLVPDAYVDTGEAVAEGTTTEKIEVVEKIEVKEKTVAKRGAAHPIKTQETIDTTVKSRVDGPIVYKEKPKKRMTAKRGRYNRPTTANIEEADLTSEEALAKEAAEELKKLRGEEDLTQ